MILPFVKKETKENNIKPVVKTPKITAEDINAGQPINFGNTLVQKEGRQFVVKESPIGNVVIEFESGKISPHVL